MPGIYIHIPFCKRACSYCNFHFSTSIQQKDALLDALYSEISLRQNYLVDNNISTIYFGGGTPSLLSADEIHRFFEQLSKYYQILPDAEVTLEANPDDLTPDYLRQLRQTPINRLSIGIQSFSDADLKFMNRSHNAQQAAYCLAQAQDMGFYNLNADLIYGSPTTSHEQWRSNLHTIFEYKLPHLSAYCLTVEPKTALYHAIQTGKQPNIEDTHAATQFDMLCQLATDEGFEHYEISNFCRPPHYALHNSNYWRSTSYIGFGPSAHSFDGQSRQWNVANNSTYIKGLQSGTLPAEREELTENDKYNEYLMTSLRTIWGCNTEKIRHEIGAYYYDYLLKNITPLLQSEVLHYEPPYLYITSKGKFIADRIIADLFCLN